MSEIKKYAKNQQELADIIGMDRTVLSTKYMSMEGAPAKTKQGYNVEKCMSWKRKIDAERYVGDGTLKDEKIKREIQILDIKIDQIQGKLVSAKETESEVIKMLCGHRAAIENEAAHQCAKHPEIAEIIEGIKDKFIKAVLADETELASD